MGLMVKLCDSTSRTDQNNAICTITTQIHQSIYVCAIGKVLRPRHYFIYTHIKERQLITENR